jgi:hypothetical protein
MDLTRPVMLAKNPMLMMLKFAKDVSYIEKRNVLKSQKVKLLFPL